MFTTTKIRLIFDSDKYFQPYVSLCVMMAWLTMCRQRLDKVLSWVCRCID